MCGWIMGIAMGWLGLVIEYFAGMAKKTKTQQLPRSVCCSSEQSLYKPPRELKSN